MNNRRIALIAGLGCLLVVLLLIIAIPIAFFLPLRGGFRAESQPGGDAPFAQVTQEIGSNVTMMPVIPTFTPALEGEGTSSPFSQEGRGLISSDLFVELYERLTPGVVSIQVNVEQGGLVGQGAGSGFILDDRGHIITNNHVVSRANNVVVVFYDGTQVDAEVIGTDDDSDLAVLRVDEMPDSAVPIPLGDSREVLPGEWVLAIGNPFSLSSTMTVGIVSAVGRAIPSGATPFSIPEAIQTDAAINPGNSGGPLLSLQGQVIGVNAQIASGSGQANSGVGFAIPSEVVRRVAPSLIANGFYQWPWLGIRGRSVGLSIMKANDLPVQQGAYVHEVISGSPADEARLRGTEEIIREDDLPVPVGGDVIVEADGQPIQDYTALLVAIARKQPGDSLGLTILRDGERISLTADLAPRPESSGN
jgi:2-alkenal reductase